MTCARSSEDLPDRAEHVQRPEGSPHPRGSAAAGTARGQKGARRGEAREGEGEMGATGGLGLYLKRAPLDSWLQGVRAEAGTLVKMHGRCLDIIQVRLSGMVQGRGRCGEKWSDPECTLKAESHDLPADWNWSVKKENGLRPEYGEEQRGRLGVCVRGQAG